MFRTVSLAGAFAVLLLAFLLVRITGGAGGDAPMRLPPGVTAAATPAAQPTSDPTAQAVNDLATWPIAAASGR